MQDIIHEIIYLRTVILDDLSSIVEPNKQEEITLMVEKLKKLYLLAKELEIGIISLNHD